jgi:hypothetical protein
VERSEGLDLLREGVVEAQGHGEDVFSS